MTAQKEDQKLVFNTDNCLMKGEIIAECPLLQVKCIAECYIGEHSAILTTFIKLPFSIKAIVLSIFKWSLKTGFTAISIINLTFVFIYMERSGLVVDCWTGDRVVTGPNLTGVTALCPLARHINPCLVLVHSRKAHPDTTENLLTGT